LRLDRPAQPVLSAEGGEDLTEGVDAVLAGQRRGIGSVQDDMREQARERLELRAAFLGRSGDGQRGDERVARRSLHGIGAVVHDGAANRQDVFLESVVTSDLEADRVCGVHADVDARTAHRLVTVRGDAADRLGCDVDLRRVPSGSLGARGEGGVHDLTQILRAEQVAEQTVAHLAGQLDHPWLDPGQVDGDAVLYPGARM
jgi:hypothetical protein